MIFKVKKIKVNSLGAQLSREFVEPPICDTICLASLLMAPAATLDRIPKILRGAIAAVAHGGWEELRTSLDARHLGNKIGASSATDG